jgi:hypothetical protein
MPLEKLDLAYRELGNSHFRREKESIRDEEALV